MIEISKPLEYFQSCNCCGRYNKGQMYFTDLEEVQKRLKELQ